MHQRRTRDATQARYCAKIREIGNECGLSQNGSWTCPLVMQRRGSRGEFNGAFQIRPRRC
jgi:hypothetical protein